MFKNNKVILLVLLIIVAFVGYRFVFKKDSSTGSDLVVESGQAGEQLPIGRELIATLSKLKSLNLDSSFFKDPIYSSLIDFSVQITPQEVGRNNPFSPIGGTVKQSQ